MTFFVPRIVNVIWKLGIICLTMTNTGFYIINRFYLFDADLLLFDIIWDPKKIFWSSLEDKRFVNKNNARVCARSI